jgi:hypothetical protein
LTTTTTSLTELPLRHLQNSRWPVSNFNQPAKLAIYKQLLTSHAQSQRTRLNTTKPKRRTRTGMRASFSFLTAMIRLCMRPLKPVISDSSESLGTQLLTQRSMYRIKKPKTHRYPSLKGTDPKFRRNHRHALHGTMKALKEVKEGKRDTA